MSVNKCFKQKRGLALLHNFRHNWSFIGKGMKQLNLSLGNND